jgi:hypothetical protein
LPKTAAKTFDDLLDHQTVALRMVIRPTIVRSAFFDIRQRRLRLGGNGRPCFRKVWHRNPQSDFASSIEAIQLAQ